VIGDIVESRVRVKEGKRRRILLLELSSAAPPRGKKGYATHAKQYDAVIDVSVTLSLYKHEFD
jgi:hypothetical protein